MNRLNRIALTLIALVCLLSLAVLSRVGGSAGQVPQGKGSPGSGVAAKYVPDELLVRFAPGVPPHAEASAHAAVGASVLKQFQIVDGLKLVKLPPGLQVKEAIKLYRQHPNVLYAEPNFIVEAVAETVPWGISQISAPTAWNDTTGDPSVVVAVIDTGIDYTHPDLSANMFPGYGIDVVNNDSDPMDDNQHGTHVAGTIGAVHNSEGVVGVNWTIRLMACKFLNASGSGTTDGAIACLQYVRDRKALDNVPIVATNNSWGGGGFSQGLFDAIKVHQDLGILFIAAAGNSALDNDTAYFYPASYYLPNVIAVAATTPTDALASFSNYGRRTVHLGAPGSDILSTIPGNKYGTLSGTSMATPHVTGVAALLKAKYPNLDWRAIKNLILAGGEGKTSLTNTITRKRLNANGALNCSDRTVVSRLRPIGTAITASAGTPIDLAALHINCATPNGDVSVTVTPPASGNPEDIPLRDDGTGTDQRAGDGIYSGQWTPGAPGVYTLTFLARNTAFDQVIIQVLQGYNYQVLQPSNEWRTISGTNLNLGDDSWVRITPGFPILFGGGSFDEVYVSSNGNLNFMGPYTAYTNDPLPTSAISTLVAPFWDDLYPVQGSAQNVFWGTTNGELVIEWRDIRHWSCYGDSLATVRFQVVFNVGGTSDILFNYADTTFDGACTSANQGGSATVGVQVGSTSATQFSYDTNALSDNTTLRWATLAQPSNPRATLTVIKAGTGSGGITSNPSGINCGSTCTATYDYNTLVTLTATAALGSTFTGWSGEGCSGTGTCTVTMNQARNVTATFTIQTFPLTVSTGGTGSGRVTSNPLGIDCGVTCTATYDYNTLVTLTATAALGSTFTGWSGACTGTGLCSVTMIQAQNVTATFTRPSITVISPTEGAQWRVGTNQTIRWTSSGVSGKVQIDLSRDSGSNWKSLYTNVANNGSKTWKVTGPATDYPNAKIRVCSGSLLCGISGAFTIK